MSVHSEKEERKQVCLDMADKLYHYKWIAASARISDDTLKNWREEDKDFSDRLEEARSRFIKNNMRKAKPDFLLETADRETFGKKQEINVNLDFRNKVIASYGQIEGKIDEVPKPTEIENRSS